MKKLLTKLAVGVVALGVLFGVLTMRNSAQPPDLIFGVSQPTYFAEIDSNGVVKRVIVADQNFINSGAVGDPANWVQTSIDGSLRKNFASAGYTYDKDIDAFVPQKPFSSWKLDEKNARWKAPVDMPNTGKKYRWVEDLVRWEEISNTASR